MQLFNIKKIINLKYRVGYDIILRKQNSKNEELLLWNNQLNR